MQRGCGRWYQAFDYTCNRDFFLRVGCGVRGRARRERRSPRAGRRVRSAVPRGFTKGGPEPGPPAPHRARFGDSPPRPRRRVSPGSRSCQPWVARAGGQSAELGGRGGPGGARSRPLFANGRALGQSGAPRRRPRAWGEGSPAPRAPVPARTERPPRRGKLASETVMTALQSMELGRCRVETEGAARPAPLPFRFH